MVNSANAKFNGSLENIDLAKIEGTAKLDLDINGGNAVVDNQIEGGKIEARATTSNIKLDSYVPSFKADTSLQDGTVNASANIKQLLNWKNNPGLSRLQADANLNLLVDGEAIAVDSQVNFGKIVARANTGQIDVNRLAPIPVPASIQSSNVTASGELSQLLSLDKNPTLSSFNVNLDADLGLANGTVKATR